MPHGLILLRSRMRVCLPLLGSCRRSSRDFGCWGSCGAYAAAALAIFLRSCKCCRVLLLLLPLSLLPLLTVHLGEPASLVLLPLEICVLCTGGVPLQSGEPCADRNCRGEHTTTVHSVHLIIILHVLLSKTLPPARSAHPCAPGVLQPPPFALQWDLALCPRVGVFGVFILIFILPKKIYIYIFLGHLNFH